MCTELYHKLSVMIFLSGSSKCLSIKTCVRANLCECVSQVSFTLVLYVPKCQISQPRWGWGNNLQKTLGHQDLSLTLRYMTHRNLGQRDLHDLSVSRFWSWYWLNFLSFCLIAVIRIYQINPIITCGPNILTPARACNIRPRPFNVTQINRKPSPCGQMRIAWFIRANHTHFSGSEAVHQCDVTLFKMSKFPSSPAALLTVWLGALVHLHGVHECSSDLGLIHGQAGRRWCCCQLRGKKRNQVISRWFPCDPKDHTTQYDWEGQSKTHNQQCRVIVYMRVPEQCVSVEVLLFVWERVMVRMPPPLCPCEEGIKLCGCWQQSETKGYSRLGLRQTGLRLHSWSRRPLSPVVLSFCGALLSVISGTVSLL